MKTVHNGDAPRHLLQPSAAHAVGVRVSSNFLWLVVASLVRPSHLAPPHGGPGDRVGWSPPEVGQLLRGLSQTVRQSVQTNKHLRQTDVHQDTH